MMYLMFLRYTSTKHSRNEGLLLLCLLLLCLLICLLLPSLCGNQAVMHKVVEDGVVMNSSGVCEVRVALHKNRLQILLQESAAPFLSLDMGENHFHHW